MLPGSVIKLGIRNCCVCVCGIIMECYNLFLVINIAPRWQLHHDRSLLHPEEFMARNEVDRNLAFYCMFHLV